MPYTPSTDQTAVHAEIADTLSRYMDAGSDHRLGELLGWSAGRVLLKAARRGEDWRRHADDEALRHIVDWLRAAIFNDDAWLHNVDDMARPRKLLKFGTVAAIVREADKAMLKAAQRASGVRLIEGDEELFAVLEDGVHVVRLLTTAALDRESSQMQHCIGNGSYDEYLDDGVHLYLSLRDPLGNPHATLEIENGTITQLQGKQNRPPVRRHLDRLIPFIRARGYGVSVPASHLGHVVDINGDWHGLDNLPFGLTVDCLDLRFTSVKTLPEGLIVDGCLDLAGTGIIALPARLTVGGYVDLRNTAVNALPDGFSVGGDLDLSGSNVAFLPGGLTVGGSLYLWRTRVTALPDGLTVGGSLYTDGSGVTTLPVGLTVGGNLDLRGTGITALPEGVIVGGDVIFEDATRRAGTMENGRCGPLRIPTVHVAAVGGADQHPVRTTGAGWRLDC